MILSYSYYNFPKRKGIVFFHQKTWTSGGHQTTSEIFSRFFDTIKNITHDEDSTRIQTLDDLGDPEIQLLESAKTRTLRSLPQSSIYWGSEMFFAHVSRGHSYLKLPRWMRVLRKKNHEFQTLELGETWSKTELAPHSSLFITLKTLSSKPFRIMSSKSDFLRLATHLAEPPTEGLPLLSLDLDEGIKD
jgi:hypothetical protein